MAKNTMHGDEAHTETEDEEEHPTPSVTSRSSSFSMPTSKLMPHRLDISTDRGELFAFWEQRWKDYALLSGLTQQPIDVQMAILRSCFSDDTLKIVRNLSSDAQKTPDTVIDALRTHARGQVNVVMERRNFNLRSQHAGELFDDFVMDLRDLAKTCDFCDACEESLIRDRVVVGIRDSDIAERLLAEKGLTLTRAIEICRAEEAARRFRSVIASDTPQAQVNAVNFKRQQKKPYKQHYQHKQSHQPQKQQGQPHDCRFCTKNHKPSDRCPAKDTVCAACKQRGHWAKSSLCRVKNQSPKSPSQAQLGCVIATLGDNKAPTVPITVGGLIANGATITATPDSGAERSACGVETLRQLGIDTANLRDPSHVLRAADNHPITQLGEFDAQLTCGNFTVDETIHVVQGTTGMYLSWYTAQALSFLPVNYPCQQVAQSPPGGDQSSPHTDHIAAVHESPESRPLPATVERDKAQLLVDFADEFGGELFTMPDEQFYIYLTDSYEPFNVRAPRPVPYAYRDKLREKLDQMVRDNVIAPVTTPTEWCAPIVVTPKKDSDDIRLCVDLSKLNKYIKRERYLSPSPYEAVADITSNDATYFTTIDALSGYWQVPLAPECQELTTFITPFGRYMFRRAPFGICSISEHYNRRMDEALIGIQNIRKIVDDIIIYDRTYEEHVKHVREVLERCRQRKISLKREKFVFAQPKAKFSGYIVGPDGFAADPSLTKAIREFPRPTNITELRSFLGLANQLSNFTDSISTAMEPLRPLLKTKNYFMWDASHDQAFEATKQALSVTPTLAYYDPGCPTALHTDASRLRGLGFVLKQKKADGKWHLIQAGSRFLTDTETRYAMIELEMLAVAWAVKKCRIFLEGLSQFDIITDHRPLITILNKHHLGKIENPRLQRLRMRLMGYNFHASWQPGKSHTEADALSRAPADDPAPEDGIADSEIQSDLHAIIAANRLEAENDIHIVELAQLAENDEEYTQLREIILDGFPHQKSDLPVLVRPYWSMRDKLAVDDHLVLCGCRLVIPRQMRSDVLTTLHMSHQGIERTKRRARLSVYWPGIDNDITQPVRGCRSCSEHLPSLPKEPLKTHPSPDRVFEHLATDLFEYGGCHFLVVTDLKSGWPTTYKLGFTITASVVISALRQTFVDTAVPTILYSDGGPQFTARAMDRFLQDWGVQHEMSSPHYPQSNGFAEAAVKAMKTLVRQCWETNLRTVNADKWAKGLLQWRNTPRADGLSPAQVVYGHPVRDTLPVHKRAFAPEWQRSIKEADERAATIHHRLEHMYNRTAHELPQLAVGTKVAVQDHRTRKWDKYGTIVEVGRNRDYMIRLVSGRVWRRNRRFLRRRYPVANPDPPNPVPNPIVQPLARAPIPHEHLPTAAVPPPPANTTGGTPRLPTRPPPPPVPPQVTQAKTSAKPTPAPRTSLRQRKPTQRLIEEIWV